jgi:hypothetical protein
MAESLDQALSSFPDEMGTVDVFASLVFDPRSHLVAFTADKPWP